MTNSYRGSLPRIGIVGERNVANPTHRATEEVFTHLQDPIPFEWLGTEEALAAPVERLDSYSAFLITPGSPYQSMDGALRVIQFARERGIPLLGTCGGFQHIVVEYVRNVLDIADAGHEETDPTAPQLAVTALTCSLVGQRHPVSFAEGSRVAAMYGRDVSVEAFFCNFGLNPEYRSQLQERGLIVSGVDATGEARVLELPDHPFFIATLNVPQASSTPDAPHPLVIALVRAAHKDTSATPVSI